MGYVVLITQINLNTTNDEQMGEPLFSGNISFIMFNVDTTK